MLEKGLYEPCTSMHFVAVFNSVRKWSYVWNDA